MRIRPKTRYRRLQCVFALLLCAVASQLAAAQEQQAADAKPTVIVVVGAAGAPEFGEQFAAWGERWRAAAEKAAAEWQMIGAGEPGETTDRDQLKAALSKVAVDSTAPAWLVFIGHGTFDRQMARFNLRGPDVTHTEIAEWLTPLKRPLAVINCTSASARF